MTHVKQQQGTMHHRHLRIPFLIASYTLLLLLFLTHNTTITKANTLDNYCGKDWVNAANACPKHCPSGDDAECIEELGDEYGCFLFTGCHDRVEAGEFGVRDPEPDNESGGNGGGDGGSGGEGGAQDLEEVGKNRYCGVNFIDAMLQCDETKKCPSGDDSECSGDDVCIEDTNCDQPLVTLKSEIVFTISGTTTPMEDEDIIIFNTVIFDLLQDTTADLRIHLESIELITQRIYEDTNTIEVDVMLEAKYRPPPEQKLATIAENTVNLQSDTVRASLKKAGNEAKRYYFTTDVKGISAVSKENATKRPTLSPTGGPTFSPTDSPSLLPSQSPSAYPTTSPSGSPSSVPSREHIQTIITASTNELKGESDTAHGFLVNMRTPVADSSVVLINGLEFYTESTDNVGFEVWTKLGSYEGYEGTYAGWDLIATGTVRGAGYAKYTMIPPDMLTPVSIPGSGGTRAFYLTLNTKDLIVKNMGNVGGNSGDTDNRVMASSPDLEIYNGVAVLSYPFPDPAQAFFYQSPRVFLGVVTYDRLPCKPYSLYGPVDELPCVDVPTAKPIVVTQPETSAPTKGGKEETTTTPTLKPSTPKPTEKVAQTLSPTISSPPTMSPTFSPVEFTIKTRIVVILHNTPEILMNQLEQGIFTDVLLEFLNNYSGKAMVVSGIDVESEAIVMVHGETTASKLPETATTQGSATSINATNTSSTSKEIARGALGQRFLKVPSMRVTVVLKIISTTLPHNLLGNMAVVAIEENEIDLVDQLRRVGDIYPYFENVNGVSSFYEIESDDGTVQSPGIIKEPMIEPEVKYEEKADEAPSVNVALIVTLFWCVLAVASVILLARARSKLMNDNIGKENDSDERNPLNQSGSETALRTSILRLIPMGADIENTTRRGLVKSRSRRSLRLSTTTGGSSSLENSLRDGSFHNENSLRASRKGRPGHSRQSATRSSMRQSLTLSQFMDDLESDENIIDGSGRDGLSRQNSLTVSQLLDFAEEDDESPLDGSGTRRNGLARQNSNRMSLRQSMSGSNHRQSMTGSNHEANLKGSAVVRRPRSGSAMRASMRASVNSNSNHDSSNHDSSNHDSSNHDSLKDDGVVGEKGGSAKPSLKRVSSLKNISSKVNDNNLRRSVAFDESLPLLNQIDRNGNEPLRDSTVSSSLKEESNTDNFSPKRVPRKQRKFSQSMTAKDTMTWGISDEKKEERPLSQSLSKNDYYNPKRKPRNGGGGDTNRRSGNESNLRRSTARGSSENLASLARSDTDMGGLRRSMSRGSGNNLRSMAKRDERRSLSQSMSGAKFERHASDGTAGGLRRSTGARGSSENLRGSMRRSSSSNNLRGSVTQRRSSDGSNNHRGSVRGSSDDAGNLRRSSAGNSKEDLRGSIRRSSDANGSSRPGPGAARGNNQQRRPGPRRRASIV